jgi:hypothetical protein
VATYGEEASLVLVSEIMTKRMIVCRPIDDATSVMKTMQNGRFRHSWKRGRLWELLVSATSSNICWLTINSNMSKPSWQIFRALRAVRPVPVK